MSKKMQQAIKWLENIRKHEKLLSRLAEQDRDLYVVMLLNVYHNIPEKEVRGMKIKALNGMILHPTVKRVLKDYTKGRSMEEYLINSKVSINSPMGDVEYEMRKAHAIL